MAQERRQALFPYLHPCLYSNLALLRLSLSSGPADWAYPNEEDIFQWKSHVFLPMINIAIGIPVFFNNLAS